LINDKNPEKALGVLKESGLLGRGGAGFPLALKWGAVRSEEGSDKYVVCNADEGEPGTLKDRPILHLEPHILLEAMAIAGFIVGASHGIIYLRYEYPLAQNILNKAIEAAEKANILGANINDTDYSFYISVTRGSGAYICGEETSLLNSLEGKRPWPRERPPFPTTSGLWGKPTAVNNVETLSVVPRILENGAKWFQSVGLGEGNYGSKLYSVSGDVNRPGNFELPLGVTVRELILTHAGGVVGGGKVKAFTLGGISGGILSGDFIDLKLDFKGPQELDTFLGSGAIVVLGEDSCIVDFARSCAVFFEEESCGKCYPCRIGAVRMRELMDGISGNSPLIPDTLSQIKEIGDVMATASACGLGQSAPKVLQGMVKYFVEELDEHILKRICPTDVCEFKAKTI
jgi:NADH:ubiquinone oxidoreductase subunit F (NADH-binding)